MIIFNLHKNLMRRTKYYLFLVSVSFLLSGDVLASDLPRGGVVKSGEASISQGRDFIEVNQSTDKAIIDWSSFDVGQNKLVEFVQPSIQSQVLNRVLGSTPSTIAGRIKANGQVFLVNPNGILITKTGLINTNSFSASTLDISNEDFIRGKLSFVKQSGKDGTVVTNNGSITVSDGGFVALLGGAIDNSGVVTAHLSKVGFGAGEKVILNIGDSEFLRVEIPTSNLNTIRDVNGNKLSEMISVNNGSKVISYGGLVKLSVGTVRKTLRRVINIRGLVQAKSASSSNTGKIIISGPDVSVNGTIDVSSDVVNVNGGEVAITSNSYRQTGSINASGNATASNGGVASILSNSNISIFAQSNILSDGNVDGGIIRINTGSSRLIAQGKISASGISGRGGLIDISADGGNVIVMDGTEILATGYSAGGLIRIGGEFAGGYQSKKYDETLLTGFRDRWTSIFGANLLNLPASYKTSLGYNTLVDASSVNGDGGAVVLWSNGVTRQFGTIKANGFNNGGWVQIAGKRALKSYKLSQVEASGQSVGTVLLGLKNLVVDRMNMVNYVNSLFKYKIVNKLDHYDYFGSSVSLVGNDEYGYKLAVGAYGDDYSMIDQSSGAVYLFSIDNFRGGQTSFVDKIDKNYSSLSTMLSRGDNFGSSVSLVGNNTDGYKLAVGAYGDSKYRGAVYLFNLHEFRNGQIRYIDQIDKKQLRLNSESRLHNNDHFGSSVSLVGSNTDGYKLAVGAYGDSKYRGAAYLFDLPEFRNSQIRYIDKIDKNYSSLSTMLSRGDNFGSSVSLVGSNTDGYKLAVGAYGDNNGSKNSGAVYLFNMADFGGEQTRYIDKISKNHSSLNTMLSQGDRFGSSVGLVGNNADGYKLAVGAYGDDDGSKNSGAVYLFDMADFGGGQTRYIDKISKNHSSLSTNKLSQGDNFGSSVSLAGNNADGYKLAVGAYGDNNGSKNSGAVYLFNMADFGGEKTRYIDKISKNHSSLNTMLSQGDHFGSSVGLVGNNEDGYKLAVGAYGDDDGSKNSGAVYLFNMDDFGGGQTKYIDKISKNHSSLSTMLSQGDHFGSSLGLVGNNEDGYKLAVGAYGDSKYRGAVYLFNIDKFRSGQTKYIDKISKNHSSLSNTNLGAYDHFGSSLGLVGNNTDGYKLAVGAYGDSKYRGAVYLFNIDKFRSGQTKYIDKISKNHSSLSNTNLGAYDHFGSSLGLVGNNTDGYKLAVGAYGDDNLIANSGSVYLFNIDNFRSGQTSFVDKLSKTHSSLSNTNLGAYDHDHFGSSVSLVGNNEDGYKLAVGAYGGGGAGEVYLFNIDDFGSGQMTLVNEIKAKDSNFNLEDLGDNYQFGKSVSLFGNNEDGHKLVVGAPNGGGGAGAVYLFNIDKFNNKNSHYIVRHLSKTSNSIYFYDGFDTSSLSENIIFSASNDIKWNIDLDVLSEKTKSGSLTLIAGRSMIIDGDIKINGKLKLVANASEENFTDQAGDFRYNQNNENILDYDRDVGVAKIIIGSGNELISSNSDIDILMQNGNINNNSKRYSGEITLWGVSGKKVSIIHNGTTFESNNSESESKIVLQKGGFIKATKNDEIEVGKTHIELKADKFINNAWATALKLASANDEKVKGRYLVWTKNPNLNTMGSITNYDFAMLNKSYNGQGNAFNNTNDLRATSSSSDFSGSAFLYSDTADVKYKTIGSSNKVYDGNSESSTADREMTLLKASIRGVKTINDMEFKISDNDYDESNEDERHGRFHLYDRTGTLVSNYEDSSGNATSQVLEASQLVTTGFKYKIKDGNDKPVYIVGIGSNRAVQDEASITPRPLTLNYNEFDFADVNLTYNGNTDIPAIKTNSGKDGLDGVVKGENITVDWQNINFEREDKNAGFNKKVYVGEDIYNNSITFGLGANPNNYTFTTVNAGTDTGQAIYVKDLALPNIIDALYINPAYSKTLTNAFSDTNLTYNGNNKKENEIIIDYYNNINIGNKKKETEIITFSDDNINIRNKKKETDTIKDYGDESNINIKKKIKNNKKKGTTNIVAGSDHKGNINTKKKEILKVMYVTNNLKN